MELDKELYRKYYAALREWSEAEAFQRIMDARRLTPEQAWNRYIALWEFAMQFSPVDKETVHLEHLKELDRYYSIVQKLHDHQMKNVEAI